MTEELLEMAFLDSRAIGAIEEMGNEAGSYSNQTSGWIGEMSV